jgi:hypothetical protein
LSGDGYEGAGWLIDAIVHGLEQRRDAIGVGEVLDRLHAQDLSASAHRPPAVAHLPACRHLPASLGELTVSESSLAAAIAANEDALHWRQNRNYSDEAMGQAGYMDNYAYAEIIGPTGPFPGRDFLLGLMILGPNLYYPDHFHSAPELYWLLTGPSDWRSGIGNFVERAAGETIWHPSLVPHATRTREAPLLTVWAWTRDVAQPAKLVPT